MANWKTELTSDGVKLGKVHNQTRDIPKRLVVSATVRHRFDPNHSPTTTVQQKISVRRKMKKDQPPAVRGRPQVVR